MTGPPDSAQHNTFIDDQGLPAGAAQTRPAPVPDSLHAFVRGPQAGTFLHDLLEWATRRGFGLVLGTEGLLYATITERCAARGWSPWVGPLHRWMTQFLTQGFTLPATGAVSAVHLRWCDLSQLVPEMEFWLAASAVDVTTLDRLVTEHTLGGVSRPGLAANTVNGMLKGYIDLVFEHQGRYYVADYKSNWLGPDDLAYTPEAMRSVVLESRYELQYTLYLLALHRLLKHRLPGYDYERHIGGAVYLFLRGHAAESQGLHFERPGRSLIEALDQLFAGRPHD